MLREKRTFLLLLGTCALFLSACSDGGCPLPPKGFTQADLVGTWSALDYRGENLIIVGNDGRYKQSINFQTPAFNYESDWRPWQITLTDQGLAYLHLKGLLMCAYWFDMNCATGKPPVEPSGPNSTEDVFADVTLWEDFCRKEFVHTPGEGVLIVMGADARFQQPQRGITLVPFTKNPDVNTGPSYELQH